MQLQSRKTRDNFLHLFYKILHKSKQKSLTNQKLKDAGNSNEALVKCQINKNRFMTLQIRKVGKRKTDTGKQRKR